MITIIRQWSITKDGYLCLNLNEWSQPLLALKSSGLTLKMRAIWRAFSCSNRLKNPILRFFASQYLSKCMMMSCHQMMSTDHRYNRRSIARPVGENLIRFTWEWNSFKPRLSPGSPPGRDSSVCMWLATKSRINWRRILILCTVPKWLGWKNIKKKRLRRWKYGKRGSPTFSNIKFFANSWIWNFVVNAMNNLNFGSDG